MTEDNPLSAIPDHGKIMGLDLGTKTIGVAISDGMRYSATPLETIKRTKFTQDAERIVELIGQKPGGRGHSRPAPQHGWQRRATRAIDPRVRP